MAQSALSTSPAAAMVSTLTELNSADITVEQLGLLDNGEVLAGPFQRGRKIIADLTPEEDTWLSVDGVNAMVLPHHEGQEAESLHLGAFEHCRKLQARSHRKEDPEGSRIQRDPEYGQDMVSDASGRWQSCSQYRA